ncbi:PHP domain-containing protein [Candidatus Omnitrophota bacterium]
MKYADLHVHTSYSDGTFSPQEVVTCARDKRIDAIAICDHDCTDGIKPCIELGEPIGVEVVPGIEFTGELVDAEVHILGYLIDYEMEWFRLRIDEMQQYRVNRMYEMIEKLKRFDIFIDPQEVFRYSGKGSVGRPHLAMAMLKSGAVDTLGEVFGKYLGFQKPCYVANKRFSPREAIEAVRKAGGVPVMAHPHVTDRDDLIPEFIEYGLRGIEVYHSDHSRREVRQYEDMAKRCGLIATGGSDCHGFGKGRILMGGVKVPYRVLETLKEESEKIKAANAK